MGAHWPKSEVTMSSWPLFSKSSTTSPPDIEYKSIPALEATSVNLGTSSGESKKDGAIRYFLGTPSGYLPSVMYARFSSHFMSGVSGCRSRNLVRYSIAFSDASVFAYAFGLRGGNRQRSP